MRRIILISLLAIFSAITLCAQDSLYFKAKEAIEYGDITEAIPLLKQLHAKKYVENKEYTESDIYYLLGAAYIEAGENDNAVKIINEGLVKFPANAELVNVYCTFLYKNEKSDEIFPFLDDNIKNHPNEKAILLFIKARFYMIQEKFDEAESFYEESLKLDDKNRDGHMDLGYFSMQQGFDIASDLNGLDPKKDKDEYNSVKSKAINYLSKGATHLRKAYGLSTYKEQCELRILLFLNDTCSKLVDLGLKESKVRAQYSKGIDPKSFNCY